MRVQLLFPTSSKAEAQRLEYLFKERYGEEHVYMICAENSESAEAQAFIRDINTRLPKLKLFIYSPSLGTGIDIKVPVRAVCAVFKGHHLPAGDLHQLLGRCRSTQETHAYVQPVKGRRLDDWQMILQHARTQRHSHRGNLRLQPRRHLRDYAHSTIPCSSYYHS
jgi:hypothetical protein